MYQEGRRRIGRDEGAWCDYTKKMMKEVGLGEYWENQDVLDVYKRSWRAIVWKKIQDKEEEVWRMGMDSKSKLRTYRTIKRELKTEKSLKEGTAQQRRVMVMLRGGTKDLRIETGRYEVEVKERICIFCESGEVGNERHFLCRCEAWKDERDVMGLDSRR